MMRVSYRQYTTHATPTIFEWRSIQCVVPSNGALSFEAEISFSNRISDNLGFVFDACLFFQFFSRRGYIDLEFTFRCIVLVGWHGCGLRALNSNPKKSKNCFLSLLNIFVACSTAVVVYHWPPVTESKIAAKK